MPVTVVAGMLVALKFHEATAIADDLSSEGFDRDRNQS
jgi:hypothetical protein